jgi:predicted nucleotide-binding protein (sugar kinase/HSP70/actin superfamily)
MESDLVHHQQHGARLDDLTGGLAYAIAENYLNRVVNGRPLGHKVFFQGGVAWNQSVRAAFQQLTGRGITVPPDHDVMGAIGVALLVREHMAERLASGNHAQSQFKGFDLADRCYESAVFECQACPNLCEINKITIADEPPLFYGARCDRFEEAGRKRHLGTDLPDLFAERTLLLLGGYVPPGERGLKRRVAIPRALAFYDLFPYWRTLFEHMGLEVVVSSPTSPRTVANTAERAAVETCFPAKLLFGHVLELLAEDVDFVFMPSLVNREDPLTGQSESNYCTFIPAMPHLVTAHLPFGPDGPRALKPQLHMQWPAVLRHELRQLAHTLGVSEHRMAQAHLLAQAAQRRFLGQMRARGQEIMAGLGPDQVAAVLVGRPYNTGDAGACQDLPGKLRKLGVLAIPLDFLALQDVDITSEHEAMFWRSGQKILAAAQVIREDPRLQAVYVTNFSCGPDSFLISFFRRLLGPKPFLELEFDDHTADAGIVTRCEAFFESLRSRRSLAR